MRRGGAKRKEASRQESTDCKKACIGRVRDPQLPSSAVTEFQEERAAPVPVEAMNSTLTSLLREERASNDSKREPASYRNDNLDGLQRRPDNSESSPVDFELRSVFVEALLEVQYVPSVQCFVSEILFLK